MLKKLFGFGKKDKDKEPEILEEEVNIEENEEVADETPSAEGQDQSTEEEAGQAEPEDKVEDALVEEVEDISSKEVDDALEVQSSDAPQDQSMEDSSQDLAEPSLDEANKVEKAEVEKQEEAAPKKKSFFGKLMDGLNKTRKGITDQIDNLLNNYGEIDEDLFEELEEILIMADVGMNTTMKIIDELRDELVARKIKDSSLVKDVLHDVIEKFLTEDYNSELNIEPSPAIVLVIGVNGAGKTTSIGKMAHKFKSEGKSVLLAAADTFRAAAIDQLKVWGERVDVNVIAHTEGSDPAAVIFDGIQAAKSRNVDVLICDTAGRLHNKKNLMNELAKIFKVIEREHPEATKEVLLVLDATTGQNAIQQAKLFRETAAITGIVLTKLDGTAKGGVVLAVNDELNIPVKMIGVGEGMEDLQEFDPKSFVKALMDA